MINQHHAKILLTVGFVVSALGPVSGCDSRPKQWDAFIYPDANNLTVHQRIAGFKSFELCQEAAVGQLRQQADPDAGDYECGYRCAPHAQFSNYVCEETKK